MRLQPGGTKSKLWGVVGGGVACAAALVGLSLAFGVPGPHYGCGGPPEAPATGVARAGLGSPNAGPCVEQLGVHEGTCGEPDANGDRSCDVGPQMKPLQCPKGCTAGATTFSWNDVFGDEVKGSPTRDLSAMCQMRKPPGLGCSYVEHLPCAASN